jgi:hypothetical protein
MKKTGPQEPSTWADSLGMIDVANLPAVFPDAAGPIRNTTAGLTESIKHTRNVERRQFRDCTRVANACKALGGLPAAGESWHIVMAGNYNQWDLVASVLKLAEPATVAWLGVCTLGFAGSNTAELFRLLDAGKVGECWYIFSNYFRSTETKLVDELVGGMERRNQRCLCMRSHCKLLLFQLSDGRHLANESSANLRSCRNLEQACFSNDGGLLTFHKAWMDRMFQEAGQ